MSTNWLSSYVERSLGDFEANVALDRDLSRLALTARDDLVARERLFTLLALKIERFAVRFRHWNLEPWTFDDVLQETFPVFVETLRRWQPRIDAGAPAGYLFYFLRVYPLWLFDAVMKLTGRRSPQLLTLPDRFYDVDPTSYEAAAVGELMLDELCEDLTVEEASILRLRVTTGRSLPDVAGEVGVTRRTAYRRWHNIVQLGRARWDAERSAG